jgi:hypothetical protein
MNTDKASCQPAAASGNIFLLAFAPMKRFWLLLLAVVLPLQMSWAAVHFCDNDRAGLPSIAAQSDPARHADLKTGEATKKAEKQVADAWADACCTAAHGCHGLHNAMSASETSLHLAAPAKVVAGPDVRRAQRVFSTRHERPQWLAA